MTEFATADERDALRSGIEREYATLRDNIEKQYVADKVALEEQYNEDINANVHARHQAFIDAGLNPDGTDPLGRPQGSQV